MEFTRMLASVLRMTSQNSALKANTNTYAARRAYADAASCRADGRLLTSGPRRRRIELMPLSRTSTLGLPLKLQLQFVFLLEERITYAYLERGQTYSTARCLCTSPVPPYPDKNIFSTQMGLLFVYLFATDRKTVERQGAIPPQPEGRQNGDVTLEFTRESTPDPLLSFV
ncbi:hypothetical protein EVAR_36989_1 [Eumeta japonica]|uniref:Uncharacterized protein n=1 Tax=Eumeta variegata TaxID=151549 RepID=A0A4C1X3C2_EUMVA|nr:hypothetical protein EVAR_36989_1 [Eumeta japonica]